MSTLWTPGGERPVGGEQPRQSAPPPGTGGASGPGPATHEPETDEELAAKMAELRRQLAETPASLVVANHCFGMFELAALHLSLQPPQLAEAQLAIDALGAVVDGLAGRLGEHEDQLKEGLSQLRLAYVQIKGAAGAAGGEPPPAGG